MKMEIVTVMALTASVLSASAGLGIGDSIVDTDVTMKNIDGKVLSINDIKGEKGTLVIFTCNHCPFALGWQDTMVKLGNTYLPKGIGVIFINSNDLATKGDSFEEMQTMAKTRGYQFPYVVDATSNVARHFGATKTPDVFLFDAAGKLVYQGAVGEGGRKPAAGGKPWLKDALDAVITGKAVEISQTKSVGCGIRFR